METNQLSNYFVASWRSTRAAIEVIIIDKTNFDLFLIGSSEKMITFTATMVIILL